MHGQYSSIPGTPTTEPSCTTSHPSRVCRSRVSCASVRCLGTRRAQRLRLSMEPSRPSGSAPSKATPRKATFESSLGRDASDGAADETVVAGAFILDVIQLAVGTQKSLGSGGAHPTSRNRRSTAAWLENLPAVAKAGRCESTHRRTLTTPSLKQLHITP